MPRGHSKKNEELVDVVPEPTPEPVIQLRTWDFIEFQYNSKNNYMSTEVPDDFQVLSVIVPEKFSPGEGIVLFARRGLSPAEQAQLNEYNQTIAVAQKIGLFDPSSDENLIDDEDDFLEEE